MWAASLVLASAAMPVEAGDCTQCPPIVEVPAPAGTASLDIARHELTWAEYIPSVIEAGCPLPPLLRSTYPADLSALAHDLPLTMVPPTRIGCYLDWLGRRTGQRYRPPTSAEWEHAARAGVTTRLPWGDTLEPNRAAIYSFFTPEAIGYAGLRPTDPRRELLSARGLVPVESFAPNGWGLYDVVGNVAEYTADRHAPSETCLAVKDAEYCRLAVFRGGNAYSIKIGEGGQLTGYDFDFLGAELRTFAGEPQPHGYRLVREPL